MTQEVPWRVFLGMLCFVPRLTLLLSETLLLGDNTSNYCLLRKRLGEKVLNAAVENLCPTVKSHHERCSPAHAAWNKAAHCNTWNKEAACRLFSWFFISITWPLRVPGVNLECQELKAACKGGKPTRNKTAAKQDTLGKSIKKESLGEYILLSSHQVRMIYTSQGWVYHQKDSYTTSMLQKEWLIKWPEATSTYCWQSLLHLERIVSYRELEIELGWRKLIETGKKEVWDPRMQIFYCFSLFRSKPKQNI